VDLIASDFLTGALLSWALPLALLIGVIVWWTVLLWRRSDHGDA
jgi:hypothetical protein